MLLPARAVKYIHHTTGCTCYFLAVILSVGLWYTRLALENTSLAFCLWLCFISILLLIVHKFYANV